MKSFRESDLLYAVFTDKEADDEIYELELFSIEEKDNGKTVFVTDLGRLAVDAQLLDSTEMHYETGIHLFTDRASAEAWKTNLNQ